MPAGTIGILGNTELAFMQIAFLDSNAYPMGQDTSPDTVTADTITSDFLVDSPVTVTFNADTQPVITFTGGGTQRAKDYIGTVELGNIDVELPFTYEQLFAYLHNNSIDVTTNAAWTMYAKNPNIDDHPDFGLIFAIRTLEYDTGANEYYNIFVLKCKIVPPSLAGAGQETGDTNNPNNMSLTVLPSQSTRNGTGELLSDTALNLNEDKTDIVVIRSSKMLARTTYVADGLSTTFEVPFTPYSESTDGTDGSNYMTVNGTQTNPSAVSASGKQVTLTGAGTTGDIIVFVYETTKATSV